MHNQHVQEENDDNSEDGWCGTPVYDHSQTNALKSFNDIFQKQISEGDQFSPSKESFSNEFLSPMKRTKQSRLLSSKEGIKGVINTEQSTRVKWFSRVAIEKDQREQQKEIFKEKQQEGISTAVTTTASWHWRNYIKKPQQKRLSISIPSVIEPKEQQKQTVQEQQQDYQPQTQWLEKQSDSKQEYDFSQKHIPIRRSEDTSKEKIIDKQSDLAIPCKPRFIRKVSHNKRIKSLSLCDALPAISIIFDTLSTIMLEEKQNMDNNNNINNNTRELRSKNSQYPQQSLYSSVSSSFQSISTQKYPEKLPSSKIIQSTNPFTGKQNNFQSLSVPEATNLIPPATTDNLEISSQLNSQGIPPPVQFSSQSISIPPSSDNPQPLRRHNFLKKTWLQRLEISPLVGSSIYSGENKEYSQSIEPNYTSTADILQKTQLQPQKTVESGVFLRFKATKQPNIEFQAKLRKRQQRNLALKKTNNTLNHTQTPILSTFQTPTVSTTGIALRLPDQKGQFTTKTNARNQNTINSNNNSPNNQLSINSTQISSSIQPISRLSYSPNHQQNSISNNNNNNNNLNISKISSLGIQPTSPSSSLAYQFIKPQKNIQHFRNSSEQLNGQLGIQKKQESMLNTRTLTQNSVDRYSPQYKNKDEKKRILYTFSN